MRIRFSPRAIELLRDLLVAIAVEAALGLWNDPSYLKNLVSSADAMKAAAVQASHYFLVVVVVFTVARRVVKEWYLASAARKAGFIKIISAHPPCSHEKDERDDETKKRDKEALAKHLDSAIPEGCHAQLMVASGWTSIGTVMEPGFLFDALKRAMSIHILMLDPDSAEAKEREKELKARNVIRHSTPYIDGIRGVIENVRRLRQEFNVSVELRTYSARPASTILAVNDEVWVQATSARFPSEQSTLYGFRREPHSLYWIFKAEFDKFWVEGTVCLPAPPVNPKRGPDRP